MAIDWVAEHFEGEPRESRRHFHCPPPFALRTSLHFVPSPRRRCAEALFSSYREHMMCITLEKLRTHLETEHESLEVGFVKFDLVRALHTQHARTRTAHSTGPCCPPRSANRRVCPRRGREGGHEIRKMGWGGRGGAMRTPLTGVHVLRSGPLCRMVTARSNQRKCVLCWWTLGCRWG